MLPKAIGIPQVCLTEQSGRQGNVGNTSGHTDVLVIGLNQQPSLFGEGMTNGSLRGSLTKVFTLKVALF